MIRIIALYFTLLLVAGCSEQSQPANLLHIHTSANPAGEFWVSVNASEPVRLLDDAQGFRPLASPDGKWLAVEVRLMSNLEVVRLFRRDGTRFLSADKDVTAVAWRQVAADHNVQLEALEQTRARLSGWGHEGTSLRLALSATVSGEQGRLETVVAVPLGHKP